jgi:polyhydroxybutyrate depolymerase
VEGGAYLALPPPGWDGVSRLPATIFFHGYGSSAAAVAGDPSFRAAFAREGVLLVLPDGLERTWAHTGSPSRARDEVAFMDAVRRDLLARFPVDPDGLLVTGFSQGGSMVWELACHRGGRFAAAYAPVAGAFWEPLPATCPGGPIDLRHVHGTADGTVPLAGRVIRGQFRQGDVFRGMAVLRAANGCSAPARVEEAGGLRCEVWDECAAGGRELRLCLHGGGHILPEGWTAAIHAWARRLPPHSKGQ